MVIKPPETLTFYRSPGIETLGIEPQPGSVNVQDGGTLNVDGTFGRGSTPIPSPRL